MSDTYSDRFVLAVLRLAANTSVPHASKVYGVPQQLVFQWRHRR